MYTFTYTFSAAVVIDGKVDAGMQKMTNYVDCSYNMCCSEGVNGTVTDPLPCKGGNSTGQITNKICSGVSRRGKEFESWRVGVSASRTWWTWWTGVGVCVGRFEALSHTHTHTHLLHTTLTYTYPPPLYTYIHRYIHT